MGVIGINPRTRILALVAAGALAAPATAAAASPSPSDVQYASGPSVQVGAGGAPRAASTGGSLPFTGFDAGALAAIGGGLLVGGAILYRRQRPGERA
jgi:hypothetical protein